MKPHPSPQPDQQEDRERGAAVVEMAFILVPFLVILFGMIDLGLALNSQLTVTNGTREAARLGTLGATAAEIEAEVRARSTKLDQAALKVTVTCENADNTPCDGTFAKGDMRNAEPGDSVVVTADYKYDLITPVPNFINLPQAVDVSSTTEMRIE